MDTNMKVRIVRDCLTAAKADLPDYMSQLWVREMPVLEFHGTMAAESMARHLRPVALERCALLQCDPRCSVLQTTTRQTCGSRAFAEAGGVSPSTVRRIPDMLARWCARHCGTPPFSARYRRALWLRLIRAPGRIPVGIRSYVIMPISYDASSFTNVTNKQAEARKWLSKS